MKTGKNTVAEVINMADHHINLQNNGELLIALGKSRFETKWKNVKASIRQWTYVLGWRPTL